MATVPSAQSQIVDSAGRPTQTWIEFFRSLSGSPSPIVRVSRPTQSPLVYKAGSRGFLSIGQGTITSVVLSRARAIVTLPAAPGIVPMAQGDVVTVSFTGDGPVASFVPG